MAQTKELTPERVLLIKYTWAANHAYLVPILKATESARIALPQKVTFDPLNQYDSVYGLPLENTTIDVLEYNLRRGQRLSDGKWCIYVECEGSIVLDDIGHSPSSASY